MTERLFDDLREIRLQRIRLNERLDTQEAEVVARIRDLGYSWERIGQELGMTRQAAWERYGKGSSEPPKE